MYLCVDLPMLGTGVGRWDLYVDVQEGGKG